MEKQDNFEESDSLTLEIKNNYERLDPAERRVADYLLKMSLRMPYLTLEEVSKGAKTSKTTVERFCKKLGFKGFKELRMTRIRHAINSFLDFLAGVDIPSGLGISINTEGLVDFVIRINVDVLLEIKKTLKQEEVDLATQIIENAQKLLLIGVGSSSSVIFDAEQRFTRLGINCYASSDPHFQMIRALSLGQEDAIFAVSYSGYTRDIVDCLQAGKSKGAKVVCLTSFPKSPIANIADCVLYSPGRRAPLPGESIASRISQMAIIDVICAKIYLNKHKEIEAYLREIEHHLLKKRVNS